MNRATQRRNVFAVALELLGAIVLIAVFLWSGRTWFAGALPVFAALLLLLTASSHGRAGESTREVGFRWDTAPLATAWLLPIVIVAVAFVLVIARQLGSLQWPTLAQSVRSLMLFMASGLLQQYLLLGFFYRRCIELIRSPSIAAIVTTLVFAALHVPNVFLVSVTFAAGLLSCFVYRRAPNLYVAGLTHGLLAYVLFQCLPPDITGGMRVGIEYLAR